MPAACYGNAARLDGKYLSNAAALVKARDLAADLGQEGGIYLLIEEAADLEYPAGKHCAVGQYLLLHQMHF